MRGWRRSALLAVLSAAALVFPLATALAYPIPAVPLWELVKQADHIVVARVQKAHHRGEPTHDDTSDPKTGFVGGIIRSGTIDHTAELSVIETWKGAHEPSLRVPYNGFLVCPAPPHYREGRTVIAFLEKTAKASRVEWRTVALSYGTLYVADEDVAVVRERVEEALKLQLTKRPSVAAHRDWLLRAADRRATRWHGLLELQRGKPALSHAEKARLARSFADEPSTDQGLMITLAVLAGFESRELDAAAVGVVDALVAQDPIPYAAIAAMPALLARFGDKDSERRLGEEPWELKAPAVRRIWEDAREELGLPPGAVVSLPDETR